jgi:hypothetical protein
MRRPWLLLVALVCLPRGVGAQGNPMGPEFRVNTYTTGGQFGASVAADSSGGFVVVWTSQDGPIARIFGQRYDSGGAPLGTEFRVDTSAGFHYLPEVASDPSGNFVVVWNGSDGSYSGVFAQRFASSGAPLGSEFRINSYTTLPQRVPSVAVAGNGDFVVAWDSVGQDGSEYGVFAQRFASSGAPLGSEFRVNTFTTLSQGGAAVAADSAGNFVVLWSSAYQGPVANSPVYGQRFASSGAPLGSEFRVSTYATVSGGQGDSSVAMEPSGDFVAVWTSLPQDGSGRGVYGQRFSGAGVPLGPEFRVNTQTVLDQYGCRVSLDASGNFVVVWTSEFALSDKVYGQRYDGSGAALGPEFRINTYTTGDQREPSVAADSLGRFVVVWRSYPQDPDTGIFGQRYSPILPVHLFHFRVE